LTSEVMRGALFDSVQTITGVWKTRPQAMAG